MVQAGWRPQGDVLPSGHVAHAGGRLNQPAASPPGKSGFTNHHGHLGYQSAEAHNTTRAISGSIIAAQGRTSQVIPLE